MIDYPQGQKLNFGGAQMNYMGIDHQRKEERSKPCKGCYSKTYVDNYLSDVKRESFLYFI